MRRRAGLVVLILLAALAVPAEVIAQTQTSTPPITIPQDTDVRGTAGTGEGSISAGVDVSRPGTNGSTNGSTGTGTSTGSSGGGSTTDTTAPPRPGARWVPSDDPAKWGTCSFGGLNGVTIRICFYDPNAGTPSAPPAPTASEIASDISTRVLPLPGVHTSPPVGSDQLVNLPTWLWVDNWRPQSTTASEAGLSVTVTAIPRSVTWRMGLGDPVVCQGGVRWNPILREEQQSSPCTFTYTRSSFDQPDLRYSGSATMTWDVTWMATNGESGSLGQSNRTTAFAMRVAEGQAVITSSGV
jgi:hypothetical protein